MRFEYNDDFKNYEKDVEKIESMVERNPYENKVTKSSNKELDLLFDELLLDGLINSYKYYNYLLDFSKSLLEDYEFSLKSFLKEVPIYLETPTFKFNIDGKDCLLTGLDLQKLVRSYIDIMEKMPFQIETKCKKIDSCSIDEVCNSIEVANKYAMDYCSSVLKLFNINPDIIYDAIIYIKSDGYKKSNEAYFLNLDVPLCRDEFYLIMSILTKKIVSKSESACSCSERLEFFLTFANNISSKESPSKDECNKMIREDTKHL